MIWCFYCQSFNIYIVSSDIDKLFLSEWSSNANIKTIAGIAKNNPLYFTKCNAKNDSEVIPDKIWCVVSNPTMLHPDSNSKIILINNKEKASDIIPSKNKLPTEFLQFFADISKKVNLNKIIQIVQKINIFMLE